jgi:hypothetical protein
MFRAFLMIVCVAAVASASAGCNKDGAYQVTWQFGARASGTRALDGGTGSEDDGGAIFDGGVQAATAALETEQDLGAECATHGVFGIRITGATDGSGEDVVLPCTVPMAARSVSAGTWTFSVHALDSRGQFKQQADAGTGLGDAGNGPGVTLNPTQQVVVSSGATTQFSVVFTSQSECEDGVDNDCDGRVDQADPDCASGSSELGPGDMACGSQ